VPNLFVFSVVYDTGLWFIGREFNRLVEQNLVVDDLLVLNAAVGRHDHFRLRQHNAQFSGPVTYLEYQKWGIAPSKLHSRLSTKRDLLI